MCGIWAMLPKLSAGFNESDVMDMKRMAIITSLRGDHSSGIFTVGDPYKPPRILKTVGDPFGIFHAVNFPSYSKSIVKEGKAVVGHGRLATKGAITAKNAHPFKEGHITLVHNGTTDLVSTDKEIEVDSHVLCQEIQKDGVETALINLAETYSNAYAVVVHDAKEGKLYFARNSSRPLHFTQNNHMFYFMSDYDHLNLFKMKYQPGCDPIKQIPCEEVNVFDLKSLSFEKEAIQVKKQWPVQSWKGYGKSYEHGYEGDDMVDGVWKPKTYPVPQTTEPAKTKIATYSKGNRVDFEVMTIETVTLTPHPSYKYNCLDFEEPRNKIVFFTNKELAVQGRYGNAPCSNTVHSTTGNVTYVRFREVAWEPVDLPTVQLANMKEMLEDDWDKLCDAQHCEVCRGKADKLYPEDCLVNHGPPMKLYCAACVKEMVAMKSQEIVQSGMLQ